MRLIDADECIEQIKKYCVGCFNYNGVRCRACSFDDAMGVVDSMPTIDDADIRRQTLKEVYELVTSDDICNICNYKTPHCWYNCGDNEWNIDALTDWLLEQMKGETDDI